MRILMLSYIYIYIYIHTHIIYIQCILYTHNNLYITYIIPGIILYSLIILYIILYKYKCVPMGTYLYTVCTLGYIYDLVRCTQYDI